LPIEKEEVIENNTKSARTRLQLLQKQGIIDKDSLTMKKGISKKLTEEFINTSMSFDLAAWKKIKAQIDLFPDYNHSENPIILIPAYDESVYNILRAVNSSIEANCEVIVLVNNNYGENKIIKRNKQILDMEIFNNNKSSSKPLAHVIDATFGLTDCCVSTARNVLLTASAYRAMTASSQKNLDNTAPQLILMTDADCYIENEIINWLCDVFKSDKNNIASPMNVRFFFDNDPDLAEGIRDENHLITLMTGEFYRNVQVAEGVIACDREEKPWIGAGMAFTLQAAIAVNGFPLGWKRREDHYLGRMLEIAADEQLGTINSPDFSDPAIKFAIRGSSRTSASFGSTVEDNSGITGLEFLENLSQNMTIKTLTDKFLCLPYAKRQAIKKMPSTILLADLLRQRVCKGDMRIFLDNLEVR
jgi:hypothetical protein